MKENKSERLISAKNRVIRLNVLQLMPNLLIQFVNTKGGVGVVAERTGWRLETVR